MHRALALQCKEICSNSPSQPKNGFLNSFNFDLRKLGLQHVGTCVFPCKDIACAIAKDFLQIFCIGNSYNARRIPKCSVNSILMFEFEKLMPERVAKDMKSFVPHNTGISILDDYISHAVINSPESVVQSLDPDLLLVDKVIRKRRILVLFDEAFHRPKILRGEHFFNELCDVLILFAGTGAHGTSCGFISIHIRHWNFTPDMNAMSYGAFLDDFSVVAHNITLSHKANYLVYAT